LNGETAGATLGAVLQDHEDLELARTSMAQVLGSDLQMRST